MTKDEWIDAAARKCLDLGYSVVAAAQEAQSTWEGVVDSEDGDEAAVLAMDPAKTVYELLCDAADSSDAA